MNNLVKIFLILSQLTIVLNDAMEDVDDDGGSSHPEPDPESVDLVVNIALSLFDSLKEYTNHLKEDEEDYKIIFKPKLAEDLIESFVESELSNPELREIIVGIQDTLHKAKACS